MYTVYGGHKHCRIYTVTHEGSGGSLISGPRAGWLRRSVPVAHILVHERAVLDGGPRAGWLRRSVPVAHILVHERAILDSGPRAGWPRRSAPAAHIPVYEKGVAVLV